MSVTPLIHTVEPTRFVPAAAHDFGYGHEVKIALPASYAGSGQTYPVLWVLDGGMYFDLAASIASVSSKWRPDREYIVVGIGTSSSFESWNMRRIDEFFTMEDITLDSIGDVELWHMLQGGHASEFLSFLIDELRPSLESEFRMSPDKHVLAGVSGGAYFGTYCLFTRPDAFADYLLASPPYDLAHGAIFELEAEFAKNHSDLDARVFFTGGADEVFEPGIADIGLIPSMYKMISTLNLRRYPSLELTCKLIDGVDHPRIAIDLFKNGVEWLRPDADGVPVNSVSLINKLAE